jgi:hypothetical protein
MAFAMVGILAQMVFILYLLGLALIPILYRFDLG